MERGNLVRQESQNAVYVERRHDEKQDRQGERLSSRFRCGAASIPES